MWHHPRWELDSSAAWSPANWHDLEYAGYYQWSELRLECERTAFSQTSPESHFQKLVFVEKLTSSIAETRAGLMTPGYEQLLSSPPWANDTRVRASALKPTWRWGRELLTWVCSPNPRPKPLGSLLASPGTTSLTPSQHFRSWILPPGATLPSGWLRPHFSEEPGFEMNKCFWF